MLRCFTIYDHPSDYPDNYVVRECRLIGGHVVHNPMLHAAASSLVEARASIPLGCVCIGRSSNDDPVIVECWI